MKTRWSSSWKSSRQTRRQRKFRHNAPLHVRHNLLRAPLSKELRKTYGRRNARVHTGDQVKVMRGKFKKKTGEVTKVDMNKLRVFVKGLVRKKVAGTEIQVPFDPSKLLLIELNMEDPRRAAIIKKAAAAKPAKPANPVNPAEAAEAAPAVKERGK